MMCVYEYLMCIYIYIYVHDVYVYIYIHIYIYDVYACIYIYIYMYVYDICMMYPGINIGFGRWRSGFLLRVGIVDRQTASQADGHIDTVGRPFGHLKPPETMVL